jgi:hypothetical protein
LKDEKEAKINIRDDIIISGTVFPYNREPELETLIGEIAVADFHSRRLKKKLSDKAAGYFHLGGGYYRKNKKNSSMSVFYHKGKLYRFSISVQEMPNRKELALGGTDGLTRALRNKIYSEDFSKK